MIHDDDLVIVDEVKVSAPIRIVFDQHRRQFHDPDRCRHRRANRDIEVDAGHPWCIATAQHGLAPLGLLLDRQGLVARLAGPLLAALSLVALCVVAFALLVALAALRRIIPLISLSSIVALTFALRLAALLLLCFLLAL